MPWIFTEAKLPQPANAYSEILFNSCGSVIEERVLQFWNTLLPISVRLLGSTTEVRLLQPLNVASCNNVTPSGIIIDVILLQFSNA